MAKKKKAKKQKGVFESPLMISLLHLIPSLFLVVGVTIGVSSIASLIKQERKVLGASVTKLVDEIETVEERLRYLKEASLKFDSENLRDEIEDLLLR